MFEQRKNIIFDLDGTLIDTQYPAGAKSAFVLGCRAPVHICGPELGNLHVYKRPGLDDFLQWCFDNFHNVGIWTLSGAVWLEEILENVLDGFPRERWSLLLTGERATRLSSSRGLHHDTVTLNGHHVVKDLDKVYRNKSLRQKGFSRNNTIIVEDTPSNCIRNYGNAIYIETFDSLSSKQDNVLLSLKKYFDRVILPSLNIRAIEKRYWLDETLTLDEKEQAKKVNSRKSSSAFWMTDAWTQGIKAITTNSIAFTN